jgi:hypothetical protein
MVGKALQLGRDNVSLAGVVGKRYGTIFHMVPDPANKKIFQLQVAQQIVDFEGLFLTGRLWLCLPNGGEDSGGFGHNSSVRKKGLSGET